MNKKGFTLIELLVVIVIIGLIAILIVPNALSIADTSKQKAYDILIENIVTASKNYYEECEYGDLSNEDKYGNYKCTIQDNTIKTQLGTLANTGFLDVKDKDENDETKKVVLDPKTKNDISDCIIEITKKVDDTYKVTYEIEKADNKEKCPKSYNTSS